MLTPPVDSLLQEQVISTLVPWGCWPGAIEAQIDSADIARSAPIATFAAAPAGHSDSPMLLSWLNKRLYPESEGAEV